LVSVLWSTYVLTYSLSDTLFSSVLSLVVSRRRTSRRNEISLRTESFFSFNWTVTLFSWTITSSRWAFSSSSSRTFNVQLSRFGGNPLLSCSLYYALYCCGSSVDHSFVCSGRVLCLNGPFLPALDRSGHHASCSRIGCKNSHHFLFSTI